MKRHIFSIVLLMISFVCAHAMTWDDLWLNSDERAYKALNQNNPQQAALLFKDPQWQGAAYYRGGNYKQALQAFSRRDNATAWYNRGNALAHLGQYQEAINAYNKALELDAHLEDARFNRDLLQQQLNNTASASTSTSQGTTPPPFKKSKQNKNGDNTTTTNNNNPQINPSSQNNAKPPSTTPPPQNNSSSHHSPPPTANAKGRTQTASSSYQDQQQQQALQNMSDDPGGLLQRKLSRDYMRSQQQGD